MKNLSVVMLFLFLLPSVVLTKEDIQTATQTSYVYDSCGNPTSVTLTTTQTRTPIIDGILFHHLGEMYVQEQIFSINPDGAWQPVDEKYTIDFQTSSVMQNQSVHGVNCSSSQSQGGFYWDIRFSHNNISVFELMSDQDVLKAIMYNRYCQLVYGMTVEQKIDFMKLSYDEFIHQLLRKDVSNRAVLDLWNEYKKKRVWNVFGEKEKAEQKILEKLKKREQKKQEQVQRELHQEIQKQKEHVEKELQKKIVQQKYNPELILHSEYESPYQKERELAFQKTVQDDYQKHECEVVLDVRSKALMKKHDIDPEKYKALSATLFEQQLFKEIANTYQKAAKIVFEMGMKHSSFIPYIMQYAHSAFESTHHELFPLATNLSDIADLLATTSLSVCMGITESLCDFADLYILHLGDTASGLVKTMTPLLRLLGGAMAMSDNTGPNPLSYQKDIFEGDIEQFNLVCSACKGEYKKWSEQTSNQQKIQTYSKFASDMLLHPKLFSMMGKATFGLIAQARNLRSIAAVSCMAESLGCIEVIETIVQAAQKEESIACLASKATESLKLEESILSLMEGEFESANLLSSIGNKFSFKEIIEKIRFFNNKIPLSETELIANIEQCIAKQSAIFKAPISQDVYNCFKNIEIMLEGEMISVAPDIEHIANYMYEIAETANGYAKVAVKGGHLAGSAKALQEAGLAVIKEEITLAHGCKHFVLEELLTSKIINKTEFPVGWDIEEIMNQIVKNCNKLTSKANFEDTKKRIIRFCKINEQIEIKLVLDRIDNEYKLITAIPWFE